MNTDFIEAPKGYQIQVGDILESEKYIHTISRVTNRFAFFGDRKYDKLNRVWGGFFWLREFGEPSCGSYYKLYTKNSVEVLLSTWYKVEDRVNDIYIDSMEVAIERETILILKNGHHIFKETSLVKCFNNKKDSLIYATELLEKIKLRQNEIFKNYIYMLDKKIENIKKEIKQQ